MSADLKTLVNGGALRLTSLFIGQFDGAKTGHKSQDYFYSRGCTIDFRGDLFLEDLVQFGYNVHIYTASHDIGLAKMGDLKFVPVHVGRETWLCSDTILYNCVIGHNSVVSVGSVVAGRIVPHHCLVEGNPAMIVAKWVGKRWVSQAPEQLERM